MSLIIHSKTLHPPPSLRSKPLILHRVHPVNTASCPHSSRSLWPPPSAMAFSQSKSSNTMRKWSTSTDRRSYSTRDKFKVSRETLIEKISIFQGHAGVLLLAGEPKSHHPLKASHVLAMDVYFRVIHKGTTIFTLAIPEVWHPAEVVKFCQTDLKYFKDWFSGWYNAVGKCTFRCRRLLVR